MDQCAYNAFLRGACCPPMEQTDGWRWKLHDIVGKKVQPYFEA